MRRMNHASRRLALAAIAGLAASVMFAAPALGQGSTITQCTWTTPGGPPFTISYTSWVVTDVGTIWDTKERKCTNCAMGPAQWCTWTRTRTCGINGGIGVSPSGPSVTLGWSYSFTDSAPTCTTGAGTGKKCTTQSTCLWTSETETPVLALAHVDAAQRAAVPIIPIQPGTLIFNVTHRTHEGLVNQWASSVVAFDGRTVPYGGSVALDQYAFGPHVYTVTPSRSLGFPFRALRFNIDLQPSSTLTNISSYSDINPTALVRYANNSPYAQFVDFTTTPLHTGLIAKLRGNQFEVAAGASVDLIVEFYTEPGYVLEAGHQYAARVDARAISPTGTLIATGQAIAVESAAADANTDGSVDIRDIEAVIGVVGTAADKALALGVRADFMPDGTIDFADVFRLVELMREDHASLSR